MSIAVQVIRRSDSQGLVSNTHTEIGQVSSGSVNMPICSTGVSVRARYLDAADLSVYDPGCEIKATYKITGGASHFEDVKCTFQDLIDAGEDQWFTIFEDTSYYGAGYKTLLSEVTEPPFLACAEPDGMQMMVWDEDGKLYTKTLSAAGGAFSLTDFPNFSGGASRVGVRVIQSEEIAKTGQKWRFTLVRAAADVALNITFPPGVTISGTSYTTIFDFEFSSGARSLASGILSLPNFFDLGLQYQLVAEGTCDELEEEEAYDDVPAEDGPAIPPEPPPTPEEPPEVEEPIWPTEPSPPTAPTVPTAPSTGCECEIYIAEAIMWGASWMADCFALAIQTFVEWAPWFVETMWEQAWALYEFHGEKIERHHEETLIERQRQTVLLERQAESLESISQSLSDIRDFGPVEVSYELGLPGQVQVQGIGDDTDDFYEGGV